MRKSFLHPQNKTNYQEAKPATWDSERARPKAVAFCMLSSGIRTKKDPPGIALCFPSPSAPVPHLCCHFSVVNPAQGGKVGGLGAVEAVIEASVVTIRKCDHKLPSFLGDLKNKGKGRRRPTGH